MPRHGGYEYGMSSKRYWTQRAKENLAESFATAEQAEEYLTNVYRQNLINFCKDYNKLLKPYTHNGEVDVEAVRLAMNTDYSFLQQYYKLQEHIGDLCKAIGDIEYDRTLKTLTKIYKNNVKNITSDLGKPQSVKLLDKRAIETAVKQPWTKDGREFSDRIWKNQEQLNANLRRTLTDSLTTGKSLQKASEEFKQVFGTSTYNTMRLIRTETLATYAKSSINTYKEYGVEKLRILVESDACDECLEHKNEEMNVEDADIGINVVPFHPNCRCCVAPVVKWED